MGDHDEAGKLTTTFGMPTNEPSTSSFINNDSEKEVLPPGYAVIDTKEVRLSDISNTTYQLVYICMYVNALVMALARLGGSTGRV